MAVATAEDSLPGPRVIGHIVLRLVVASLLVAAAAACIALLRGDVTDVDWKVIACSTMFAISSACAGAGLAARFRHPVLGYATVALSVAAFVLANIGMWPEVTGDAFWQVTGSLGLLAVEAAHAAFVLSRRRTGDPPGAVVATGVAVAGAAVSGAMTLYGIWLLADDADFERYARFLAVALVIQVAATAVAPLLRRLRGQPGPPVEPALTPAEQLAKDIAAAADRIERLAGHAQVADECERLRALARAARTV